MGFMGADFVAGALDVAEDAAGALMQFLARLGQANTTVDAGGAGSADVGGLVRILAACAEGDLLRTQLAILRRLARFTPTDVVALSRTVARHAIQLERFPV